MLNLYIYTIPCLKDKYIHFVCYKFCSTYLVKSSSIFQYPYQASPLKWEALWKTDRVVDFVEVMENFRDMCLLMFCRLSKVGLKLKVVNVLPDNRTGLSFQEIPCLLNVHKPCCWSQGVRGAMQDVPRDRALCAQESRLLTSLVGILKHMNAGITLLLNSYSPVWRGNLTTAFAFVLKAGDTLVQEVM